MLDKVRLMQVRIWSPNGGWVDPNVPQDTSGGAPAAKAVVPGVEVTIEREQRPDLPARAAGGRMTRASLRRLAVWQRGAAGPPAPRGRVGVGRFRLRSRQQRGAAVLLALFVATLSTLIVSALFYRQFVLLRTIENQQLMTQSRLLLRGALDWGRAILREDANRSSYDALSEPWAQPLMETRLDQLGETSALASMASIAGSMEDAQSRFNLRNLVENGQLIESEVEALRRLCELLQVPAQTADLIALRMQEALPATAPDDTGHMPEASGKKRPDPADAAE